MMLVTVGVTEPNLTSHPLGLESEMTVGDDQTNPYRSIEEAERTREVERKQKEHEDDKLFKSVPAMNPAVASNSVVDNPTDDPDPYAFDDIGEFELPGLEAFDPSNDLGPQF